MYGLAASEDLSFFVGVDLLQICVGKNELILNFDKGVRLTILSDFAVESVSGTLDRFDDPVTGAAAVIGFLHETVEGANATEEGSLRVRFTCGRSMLVFDTSRQYESFLISAGERQIVV